MLRVAYMTRLVIRDAPTTPAEAAIAALERQHRRVRELVRRLADGFETLELKRDPAPLVRACEGLHAAWHELAIREQNLVTQLLDNNAPLTAARRGEREALRIQFERLRQLGEKGVSSPEIEVFDALQFAAIGLGKALTCHLCRQDVDLLPLLRRCAAAQGETAPN